MDRSSIRLKDILVHGRYASQHCIAERSIEIRFELAEHDSCIPSIIGIVGLNCIIEISCRHPSTVRILGGHRLAKDHLALRNTVCNDLVDRGLRRPSSGNVELSSGVIIDSLSLVVELDVVEFDQRTGFLVNG